jgi:hypothetical protein
MNECNEILFHFFAGYFHQDWKLDDPSWQHAVNRFVCDDGEEAAEHVCEALKTLLGEVETDVQLTKVLAELGCYYWAGSPSEMRVWLENLNAKLQAHQA